MPTILDGPMVAVMILQDCTLPTGEHANTGEVAYVNTQQASDMIRHNIARGATDEEVKKFPTSKSEQAQNVKPDPKAKPGDPDKDDKEKK